MLRPAMNLPNLRFAPSANLKDSPLPTVVYTLLGTAALFGALRWLGSLDAGDTTITTRSPIGDLIQAETIRKDGTGLTRISTNEGTYFVEGTLSASKGERMAMVYRKNGNKSICNSQNNCANLHSYAQQTY